MKTYERELAELKPLKDDIEAVRSHNAELQKAIMGIQDDVSEKNRPDPMEHPEEYDKWMEARIRRNLSKEETARRVVPPKPQQPQDSAQKAIRFQAMEDAVATIYDDYYETIEAIKGDLENDPYLAKSVWSSPNPFKKAYTLAKEKKEKSQKAKKTVEEQGFVEGGGETKVDIKDFRLTPDEQKIAKALRVTPEAYKKQLVAMGRAR